ncbi:MAG: porin [Candidatus Omnitrophica bacterium]|nr:porin [Candidatus Omnitrophota bacterium]
MSKKIICTVLVVIFNIFCVNSVAFGDELTDLKKQIVEMQRQMGEAARQMKLMRKKIEEMELRKVAEVPSETPAQPAKPAGDDLRVYWKNGLHFKSLDDKFNLRIGGRFFLDTARMWEQAAVKDAFGDLNADVEVRRLRVYLSGDIYEDYIYKLQVDFAGGNAALRDAYIGMKNIPYFGQVRVGQFTESISIENLTSSNYITFMERDMPEEILCPHRNDGIEFSTTLFDDRATLSAGAFLDADGYGLVTSHEPNFTGRFTILPWYEEDGAKLLHLGAAYSFRNAKEAHYAGNPEAHLAPDFVDTGVIPVDHVNLIGLEAVLIHGPFSVQGEFLESIVDQRDGPSSTHFEGAYVQASYFLTGEHRNYRTNGEVKAVFGGITPKRDFSVKGWAPGAWEVATRYSYLDLNDDNIKGGILSDVTLGVNWYLNPNMRIMMNYVHAHANGKGNADIGMMRFQINY